MDFTLSLIHLIKCGKNRDLGKPILAWIIIVPAFFVIVFLTDLLSLHIWLIFNNVTTREVINNAYVDNKNPNPFLKYSFLEKITKTGIHALKIV